MSVCPCLPLQLEECNDLLAVDVLAIGMETLSLGTCPHLTSLNLKAPVLQTLDLRCDTHPWLPNTSSDCGLSHFCARASGNCSPYPVQVPVDTSR